MCELAGAVDSPFLGELVAHLTADELPRVERALVLDLA
jgi:hypothetical protein